MNAKASAAAITLAMALGNFVQFTLGPLAPFLGPDLNLSRTQIGSLTAVHFLVGVVLSPIVGPAVDRAGARTMMAVLFGTAAASLAAIALSPAP